MLKRYYKVDEAAEFLSAETQQKITSRDVLDIASRGEIALCTWLSASVAAIDLSKEWDGPDFRVGNGNFFGYIQIRDWQIAPDNDCFFASYIYPYECIGENELPDYDPERHCLIRYDLNSFPERLINKDVGIRIEDVVVPAVDLLRLTRKDLPSNFPQPSSVRESSMLAVLAAMMSAWPGGKLPSGKDLEKAAQAVGVEVSDDTIRKAIAAARNLSASLKAGA